MLPEPAKVNANGVEVALFEMPPPRVKVAVAALPMVVALPKVIALLTVTAVEPLLLYKAPTALTPVPFKAIVAAVFANGEEASVISNSAPEVTFTPDEFVVPLPIALTLVKFNVPAVTLVAPLYVLVPPNEMTEPAPSCVTIPPVPLMLLLTVEVPLVKSNNKVPASATAPEPSEPVAPALPICSVPLVMVVVP